MSDSEMIFAQIPTSANKAIGVARLNQPKTLNALSFNMIDSLTNQLLEWRNDENIVAIWLESTLDKSFCAGGNLLDVYKARKTFTDDTQYLQNVTKYFRLEYQLDHIIHTYPKPFFAFSQGLTIGGGMGLFQGANYRLVSQTSSLAMPETKIGLFPDVGATYFYNKLPLHLTLFLSLSGINVNAKDALLFGLADYYLPAEEQENMFNLLTGLDWSNSEATEAQIHNFLANFSCEVASQIQPILPEIQAACSSKLDTQVVDNLINYTGDNKYLQIASKLVKNASPSSLKLTAQLMRHMRNKTLEDSLQMDYVITSASAIKGEFVEGIRALIVDKDQKPQWRFSKIQDVEVEWLANFFALLPDYEPLNLD